MNAISKFKQVHFVFYNTFALYEQVDFKKVTSTWKSILSSRENLGIHTPGKRKGEEDIQNIQSLRILRVCPRQKMPDIC